MTKEQRIQIALGLMPEGAKMILEDISDVSRSLYYYVYLEDEWFVANREWHAIGPSWMRQADLIKIWFKGTPDSSMTVRGKQSSSRKDRR